MKKVNILAGILLSVLFGWTLGFLRLPYFEFNQSFFIGFIACLTVVFIVLLLLSMSNKFPAILNRIQRKNEKQRDRNATNSSVLFWGFLYGAVLLGSLIISLFLFNQNKVSSTQIAQQNSKIADLLQINESDHLIHSMTLMDHVFDQVSEELMIRPEGPLSEALIARIVALNYSFQPQKTIEADSLSEIKLSAERGHLLLVLSKLKIDSVSLVRIFEEASFSGASLSGANMSGARLWSIDLSGANLKDADLSGAQMDGADLKKANLWGANLQKASLRSADLKRGDLSWANLDSANLTHANMNGVLMSNAKLRGAKLSKTRLQWAELNGALFNGADMTEVDFFGSNLTKINLTKANLTNANLRRVKLDFADLSDAELSEMTVEEENWLDQIREWNVTGSNHIRAKYKMIPDPTGRTKYQLVQLEEE